MNRKVLLWIFTIVFLLVLAWFFRPKTAKTPSVMVSNFEQCQSAGYPILQTYPLQCKTPAGKTFFQTIQK